MKTFLILTLLVIFTSCGNSLEFKESPIPPNIGQFKGIAISFDNIKEKILGPQCIQCHVAYNDYQIVFSDKDKILNAVLKGTMPKNAPALSDDLKSLLSAWVRSGAPLGGGKEPLPPTELEPTWDSLSKKVFFPKCVQCHNPNGQAKFMDLSTRQRFFEERDYLLNNFEDVENSFLVEILRDTEEPMPPRYSNLEMLSEEEVKVIIKWVENGLP
jgi:hypothetical protein